MGTWLALVMLFLGSSVAAAIPPLATAKPGPALGQAEIVSWLDRTMPGALTDGDIAGAVVVVVKDGYILAIRPYGVSDVATKDGIDPARTLFRMGSVSKLVTWTAVMQQVELGRLDLDQDVNRYLDFHIPTRHGLPITLRNLMTHTAGFEEHMKTLFVSNPGRLMTLDRFVRSGLPIRVYTPGVVPAYSNYDAALAAYIVQRVSGEAFPDYVDHHILAPLGMGRSTFRQILPLNDARWVSKTYATASGRAKPFEWVNNAPAGGLTTTGADMARFMLAWLNGGNLGAATMLKPTTVAAMERSQNMPARPFETMGLGFIPTNRNGHRVVGHDGDLQYSKTVLYLLPDDHVGLFLALNSAGSHHAAYRIRTRLLIDFMNRYFPAPPVANPQAVATGLAHGRAIAGTYGNSRAAVANVFALRTLRSQDDVTADAHGVIEIPGFETPDGETDRWVETAPWFWTNMAGDYHMVALRADGGVTGLATDEDTTSMLLRAKWWQSGWFNLPLLYATLTVLVIGILLWLAEIISSRSRGLRRRTGIRRALGGVVTLVAVAAVAAALLFQNLIGRIAHVETLDDRLNTQIHAGQLLSMLVVGGSVFAVINMVVSWRDATSSQWVRSWNVVMMLGCLSAARFAIFLHLIGWSTQF